VAICNDSAAFFCAGATPSSVGARIPLSFTGLRREPSRETIAEFRVFNMLPHTHLQERSRHCVFRVFYRRDMIFP
jgi:hypothetical protein